MTLTFDVAAPPREVFAPWGRAQRTVDALAREAPPSPAVLRATGFLRPDLAGRVTEWFTGPLSPPHDEVRTAYRALELEISRLYGIVHRLGVRVRYTHADDDPYANAEALCAELRRHGTMAVRTVACDLPHPLLDSSEGGVLDELRVVHDVFGHAALGLGFDLQAEFSTWLQCRTLFSPAARGAAFCELVGAVTAYVVTGDKPALRADLPPAELAAACDLTA
jgi:hypothetical protein